MNGLRTKTALRDFCPRPRPIMCQSLWERMRRWVKQHVYSTLRGSK